MSADQLIAQKLQSFATFLTTLKENSSKPEQIELMSILAGLMPANMRRDFITSNFTNLSAEESYDKLIDHFQLHDLSTEQNEKLKLYIELFKCISSQLPLP